MKLKKKLQFKGHVYFEPVSSGKVFNALSFITINNEMYKDNQINMDRIQIDLLNFCKDDEKLSIEIQDYDPTAEIVDSDEAEIDNPLDDFRQASTESFTQPLYSTDKLVKRQNCEELAFPKLLVKVNMVILQKDRFHYIGQNILIKDS